MNSVAIPLAVFAAATGNTNSNELSLVLVFISVILTVALIIIIHRLTRFDNIKIITTVVPVSPSRSRSQRDFCRDADALMDRLDNK